MTTAEQARARVAGVFDQLAPVYDAGPIHDGTRTGGLTHPPDRSPDGRPTLPAAV